MFRYLLFIFLIFITAFSVAQTDFQVGVGRASLEPDLSIFSTALAGYGLPREGRFSITWKYLSDLPEVNAVTQLQGMLYAISGEGNLLAGQARKDSLVWKHAATNRRLISIFSRGDVLYGIDVNGEFIAQARSKGKLAWKKVGSAPKMISASVIDGTAYGASAQGIVYSGDVSLPSSFAPLENSGVTGRIISLTTDGTHLYALNSADSLFVGEASKDGLDWMLIGRNN